MDKFWEQSIIAMVGDRAATISAVELAGEIFVVLKASSNPSARLQRVDLMFPLSKVAHQKFDDPKARCRWVLNDPLPASLFENPSAQEKALYDVRSGPSKTFPLPATH